MNELDTKIRRALQAATELPDAIPEPTLTEEILETFHGRHRFLNILNISGAVKLIGAGVVFYVCIYQFFQQESTMAMMAYATATVVCLIVACTTMLWLWVQINHNTTVREIRRLELQITFLTQALRQQNQDQYEVEE